MTCKSHTLGFFDIYKTALIIRTCYILNLFNAIVLVYGKPYIIIIIVLILVLIVAPGMVRLFLRLTVGGCYLIYGRTPRNAAWELQVGVIISKLS